MLIRTKEVCRILGISRSGFLKLKAHDPSFPRSFKVGSTMQSAVYYRKEEIENWLKNKYSSGQKGE